MARPIGYKILVRPKDIELKTKSGIVLAVDERQEKQVSDEGVVIAIGEDAFKAFNPTTKFCGLKVGDEIYFAKYAGKWIRDKETAEDLLLILDEDVIGWVN